MSTLHQAKITSPLLGEVNIAFAYTGGSNPDIIITDVWIDVTESGAVVALNTALTRTTYARAVSVDLDKRLFPAIRLGAWDDLVDQAQRDLDPSFNSSRMAAE